MALGCGQVRQVGVNVSFGDEQEGAVLELQTRGVRFAEDADEVGDPLLVALPGQQSHDHQLDAQEHE